MPRAHLQIVSLWKKEEIITNCQLVSYKFTSLQVTYLRVKGLQVTALHVTCLQLTDLRVKGIKSTALDV